MRKTSFFDGLVIAPFMVLAFVFFAADFSYAKAAQNSGEVVFKVTVDAPSNSDNVRLWIPYPVSGDYQDIEDVKIDGNFDRQNIRADGKTGNLALYAEWDNSSNEQRYVTFSFKASSFERKRGTHSTAEPAIPEYIKPFLKETKFIPTGGEVRKIALKATKGKTTIAEKHKAIYDWVVENTKRDPSVKGCGTGIVEKVLAKRSGKCTDLSSVYVALARAAGVPAREVFGLRLGKKKGESDLTGGHHCWAEYYQPGYGWIETDPADVLKYVYVNKISLKQADDVRKFYLNSVDSNRIVLGRGGRALNLNPPQNDGPLNYFMYPYAEVNGKSLEWLAAQKKLKYKVTFKRN